MIVKNEEQFIRSCILSVKPAVDEIVIVDNGSTDRTPLIAEELGAKVITSEASKDFSELRNLCLNNSSGDWILSVDADEVFAENSINRLVELTRIEGYMGFRFPFITYMKNSSWFILLKLRLFKKDLNIRWEGTVHESVTPSIERLNGKILDTNIFFHHYGPLRTMHLSIKPEYINLMKAAIDTNPKDVRLIDFLGIAYTEIGLQKEAIAEFKRALDIDPTYIRSRYNLAITYLQTGNREQAIEEFKKALDTNPEMLKKLSFGSFLT